MREETRLHCSPDLTVIGNWISESDSDFCRLATSQLKKYTCSIIVGIYRISRKYWRGTNIGELAISCKIVKKNISKAQYIEWEELYNNGLDDEDFDELADDDIYQDNENLTDDESLD